MCLILRKLFQNGRVTPQIEYDQICFIELDCFGSPEPWQTMEDK